MSTNANKALVRRLVEEIFAHGRPDAVDELIAPDFVSHTWGITDDPRVQLKAITERVHAGLRDVEFEINDLVAEDDRVAVRLTASATVIGEFMGVPADGKRYEIGEIHLFRIGDGQVAEHWHQHDRLGLMQQLGAMP